MLQKERSIECVVGEDGFFWVTETRLYRVFSYLKKRPQIRMKFSLLGYYDLIIVAKVWLVAF